MNRFLYLMASVFLMASCDGQSNRSASTSSRAAGNDTVISASLVGEWLLEQVAVSDTLEVNPGDMDPEARLCVQFCDDGTFNFQTGCNAIGGRYLQSGDSVGISDMTWTEMACEDMRVEELLRTVLPQVNGVEWNNDSIVRLNTSTPAYVVLRRGRVGKMK